MGWGDRPGEVVGVAIRASMLTTASSGMTQSLVWQCFVQFFKLAQDQSYWPIADAADEKRARRTLSARFLANSTTVEGWPTPPRNGGARAVRWDGTKEVAFADVGLAAFQQKSAKGVALARYLPGAGVVGYDALYRRAYAQGARILGFLGFRLWPSIMRGRRRQPVHA